MLKDFRRRFSRRLTSKVPSALHKYLCELICRHICQVVDRRRGSSAKRAGEGSVGCNQSDMKQYLQFEGINTTQLTSACRVQCAAVGKGGFKAESRGVVFLAWMLCLSVIPAGKQTNKDEVLQAAALLDPQWPPGATPTDRRRLSLTAIHKKTHLLPFRRIGRHATRHLFVDTSVRVPAISTKNKQ